MCQTSGHPVRTRRQVVHTCRRAATEIGRWLMVRTRSPAYSGGTGDEAGQHGKAESMTNVVSCDPQEAGSSSAVIQGSTRAHALAERLERGVRSLAALARDLTDAEWQTRLPRDGRKIGVVVNHVASVLPVEIQLAQTLAAGKPVEGVTMDDIHAMNAAHARENEAVTREATLALLERNSASAAAAIRALSDVELDNAATASLYSDAPVTCQFMLEDHAVRHSYHHVAGIKRALKREK